MDAAEFRDWEAFDAISPIGDERADFRTGMLLAMQFNLNRKKGSPAKTFLDYMFFLSKPEKKRQSLQEMAAIMKQITLNMGGKIISKITGK